MNRDFKRLIYIVVGVGILIVVAKLFLKLLPWLVLAGGIVYVASRIKNSLEEKKLKSNDYNESEYRENVNDNIFETDPESYTNGQVIDVDYEEVDNK